MKNYSINMHIPIQADIRVVLTWNTDVSDLELHVIEVKNFNKNSNKIIK